MTKEKSTLVALMSATITDRLKEASTTLPVIQAAKLLPISDLSKDDKKKAHIWITGEIVKLFKWLNFTDQKIPENEVLQDWAFTILNSNSTLTPEEIVIAFRMIREGRIELGMFERLGYDVLKRAMDAYVVYRQRQLKPEREAGYLRGEEVSGYLENIRKTIEANKPKETKVKVPRPTWTDKDELEELKMRVSSMSKEELLSLIAAYENSNVYDHVEGRSNKYIDVLQNELFERSRC